jgi:hypothetical protein
MKANRKSKNICTDTNGYTKIIGGLVALLLTIIIGVLVFWEVDESINQFEDSTTEYITTDKDGTSFTRWDGATSGSNYTGEVIELKYSPSSVSNITCWNGSAATAQVESYLTTSGTDYSTNHKLVTLKAGQASNFTQVNITYVSNAANNEGESTDTASTVFALAPLIALVVVAAIILGVILGFGGSGKQGGL